MAKQWLTRLLPYWRAFFLYLLLGFVLGIVFANLSWRCRAGEGSLFSMALMEEAGSRPPELGNYFRYLLRKRSGLGVIWGGLGFTMLGIPAVTAGLLWLGFLGGALSTMGILQAGLEGFLVVLGGIIPQAVFCLPGLFFFLAVVYRMSERRWRRERLETQDYGGYLLWCLLAFLAFMLGSGLESLAGPKILQKIIEFITKN